MDQTPNQPRWPSCGMSACPNPATHADSSGVGYCAKHADSDCLPVSERPFDTWWEAATIAADAGGAEAEKWRDLEYGEWPPGYPVVTP